MSNLTTENGNIIQLDVYKCNHTAEQLAASLDDPSWLDDPSKIAEHILNITDHLKQFDILTHKSKPEFLQQHQSIADILAPLINAGFCNMQTQTMYGHRVFSCIFPPAQQKTIDELLSCSTQAIDVGIPFMHIHTDVAPYVQPYGTKNTFIQNGNNPEWILGRGTNDTLIHLAILITNLYSLKHKGLKECPILIGLSSDEEIRGSYGSLDVVKKIQSPIQFDEEPLGRIGISNRIGSSIEYILESQFPLSTDEISKLEHTVKFNFDQDISIYTITNNSELILAVGGLNIPEGDIDYVKFESQVYLSIANALNSLKSWGVIRMIKSTKNIFDYVNISQTEPSQNPLFIGSINKELINRLALVWQWAFNNLADIDELILPALQYTISHPQEPYLQTQSHNFQTLLSIAMQNVPNNNVIIKGTRDRRRHTGYEANNLNEILAYFKAQEQMLMNIKYIVEG